jgi:hypothetical protein
MRSHFLVSGYSDIITGTPELAQSDRNIQHSCTCLGGCKSPGDNIIQIALHNGINLKDIIPHMFSIYSDKIQYMVLIPIHLYTIYSSL